MKYQRNIWNPKVILKEISGGIHFLFLGELAGETSAETLGGIPKMYSTYKDSCRNFRNKFPGETS